MRSGELVKKESDNENLLVSVIVTHDLCVHVPI